MYMRNIPFYRYTIYLPDRLSRSHRKSVEWRIRSNLLQRSERWWRTIGRSQWRRRWRRERRRRKRRREWTFTPDTLWPASRSRRYQSSWWNSCESSSFFNWLYNVEMKFVWWNVRVPSWFYIIQLRRRRGGTCRSRGHQRKKKQKRISWIPYWKYKVWYSNLYLIIRIFKNQKNVPSSTLAGSESWWKDQTWENIEGILTN